MPARLGHNNSIKPFCGRWIGVIDDEGGRASGGYRAQNTPHTVIKVVLVLDLVIDATDRAPTNRGISGSRAGDGGFDRWPRRRAGNIREDDAPRAVNGSRKGSGGDVVGSGDGAEIRIA